MVAGNASGVARPDEHRADEQRGPEGPSDLRARSWWGALKRSAKEFKEDNCTDWAAALTYYGVLACLPRDDRAAVDHRLVGG